jgi:hypothetical protein
MRKPPRRPDFHASKHHDRPRRSTLALFAALLVLLAFFAALIWLTFM